MKLFHYAFKIKDIPSTRKFYIDILGCEEGRSTESWIKERLQASDISFIVEPQVRYEGKPGEQATMFFLDYSGNAIEMKAFKNEEDVFSS